MNVLALTLTFSVQLSFSGASHFFCSTLTIKTHHSGLRLEVECGCDNERWEWEMNVFCSTILLTFSVQLDIIYPSLVEGASHFFCSNSNIIEYLGCYSLQRNGKTLDIMLLWLGWTENHVFIPSVWYQRAVDHFDEPVPRSRLRGHSEKNTDELPLFVRRRRDARSIPSSTNHQLQWQTWLLRNEYQYLFGTKGINIAFDTYMKNIVH